jgi:hypothetical protein
MKTPVQIVFQIMKRELLIEESSQAAYGSGFGQFPDEKELLKAHLVVELIERYRYPVEALAVGAYIPVRANGIRYVEADIVVRDKFGDPFIFVEVQEKQHYEEYKETAMRRLFLAAAGTRGKTRPQFLLYYTRWYQGALRKTRQIVVDCTIYKTYEAWDKALRPSLHDIPLNQ